MKLVVTGRDTAGRSVFVRDGAALRSTAFPDGGGFQELWVTEVRGLSALGLIADRIGDGFPFFPGPGDTRFRIVRLVPGYLERAAEAPAREGEPGADVLEADAPGMHTTDSVDFGVVLRGEVELELDDGQTRVLRAGDCFVQRATRHRWRPVGDEPLEMAVAMMGTATRARRVSDAG